MTVPDITLTTLDRNRLWWLWESGHQTGRSRGPAFGLLGRRLTLAATVPSEQVTPDVVTMNSRVRVRDLDTNQEYEKTLVYPANLVAGADQTSVLSPSGLAMLGRRVGATVEFATPMGTRRLQIVAILYQPEAAGDYSL